MKETYPQGFLAVPPSGSGPGILVLHAWWGLNDTIRGVCTRLAEEGFTAFAPDLYHGEVVDTIPDAEILAKILIDNFQETKSEIADAVTDLLDRVAQPELDLAVIGFSLGAFCALDLAAEEPDRVNAVVVFYGTGDGNFSASRAAFLGHFAENDPFEPQENVDWLEKSLKKAGRPVTFYHYPGTGHWFFEPDRSDAYDESAAALAWERTLAFLKETFAL